MSIQDTLFGSLIVLCALILYSTWAVRRHHLHAKVQQNIRTFVHRHAWIYIMLSFTISLFMLGVFGGIAWSTMFGHSMMQFDNLVASLVRSFSSPATDTFMIKVTQIGSASFYGPLTACVITGLVWRKRISEATTLLICVAGGALLNEALKNVFERSRPDLIHMVKAGGYSFPSGHAMVSLCCFGLLAFLLARYLPGRCTRFWVFIVTAIFILAVGISRIYLGVHYPTDVLAGFSVGAMWLTFCVGFLLWWEHY